MIAKVRPAIRLRPAPALDPPYDDEAAPQPWSLQLALQLDGGVRRRTTAPAPVPPAPVAPVAASAEARRAARRFLDMVLEILNGYRPVNHIRPLAGQVDTEQIVEQVSACLERADALRRTRQPARAIRRPNSFVQLKLLRVCEPRQGVAEAAAALCLAERTWAVAYRMERRRGTWLCTAIRLV